MKTFLEFLQEKKDSGSMVKVLGFRQRPEKATIKDVFTDCVEIEFMEDDFDESAPRGKYIVPFSVIALETE